MDGITILSEMSVRCAEMWQVIGVTLVGIIGSVALVRNLIGGWQHSEWSNNLVLIIVHVGLILFVASLVYLVYIEYDKVYTSYNVSIDDSVGFNEFNKRYEIVSQDGDVYTVIEKELAYETN